MLNKEQVLKSINGLKLNNISLACQMIALEFGRVGIHCQCLTRIRKGTDILFTTQDYQCWDGKEDTNNDEWYFCQKYKPIIEGGVVEEININNMNDLFIKLDNGVCIEVYVSNGYYHYEEEQEQWRLLVDGKKSYHMVVYNKHIEFIDND